jgi:hypothetical protein
VHKSHFIMQEFYQVLFWFELLCRFAQNDDVDAAVCRSSFSSVIGCNRTVFSVTDGGHALRRNLAVEQVLQDVCRSGR